MANTSPVFPLLPKVPWCTLTAANTAKDGTGTVGTVFTAKATVDGSRIDYIKARAKGTNVQTVVRIFLNNGSTNATATNNSLFHEVTLPATTLSETQEQPDVLIPMNLPLPPGYVVNLTLGTAVSAGWAFASVGGDY